MDLKLYFQRYTQLGQKPEDTEEEKVQKSSLLFMTVPFMMIGFGWGGVYFSSDLIIPGLIPFCYGIFSIFSVVLFAYTRNFIFFRNAQLVLVLFLPFFLQLSMGGFIPSSAVIMFAIINPAGALVFQSKRIAILWYLAFAALVFIAYFLNDYLSIYIDWQLTDSYINSMFLMNIIGISLTVFLIQYYFAEKQSQLKKDIRIKNLELEAQSNKLRELDEAKSRFFANISHEFRTPLTLILGLVNKQIERKGQPPLSSDTDTMKRNAQRLLQLINQLLDLAKLESGELQLSTTQTDIISFSKNLTAQFESMAASKQIEFTFNRLPVSVSNTHLPLIASIDHEKWQQILTNLLSNAMKFTQEGGKVGVDIHPHNQERKIYVRVSNTGEGIPAEKLPHIFDRFFQVDDSSIRQYEGTGIGLALVKELVDLHGGKIEVESDGQLTLFTIVLPYDENAQVESGVAEVLPSQPKTEVYEEVKALSPNPVIKPSAISDTDRLQILLAEDNHDLRAFISEMLGTNYSVIEAENGKEGLEKATAVIPDLIISDVMMPGMDGYEFCRHLKTDKRTDHIPVILLTAKASRENRLEGLGLGADDYLVKPFDREELEIRIKNLLENRARLQQKFQQEVILQPKAVKISSVHQQFLESLKEIIEQHIDNDQFGVEDLGREIGMSRSQIHRKLKALTDQSATAFIRNYRLHRAADLLKQDAGNITEIAYQVGFSSQTYFSSRFQEQFGCSPTEYRQQGKG